ncbi:IclR family transcriptional regulator (plasmid) [Natronosalvus halobius]|nr:IclR family transcriptional regulator [Natronosalvus halobius]
MARTDERGGKDKVKTARTIFTIVEFIKDNEGSTITVIANELGFAKSTVHRHITTLLDLGYIVETPTGYEIGLQFLDLGQRARTRHPGYKLAQDKVEELANQTGERAQFLVEEHGEAVYIHRSFGDRAVRTDPGIGSRIPLHATAAGKAILAQMDDDRRAAILDQTEFDPITDSTITDRQTLLDELETISRRGYSFNREENLGGLHAVGAAVCGPNDEVIGALSISGPSHRLKGQWFDEELPNLLLGTANELELNIAYS